MFAKLEGERETNRVQLVIEGGGVLSATPRKEFLECN